MSDVQAKSPKSASAPTGAELESSASAPTGAELESSASAPVAPNSRKQSLLDASADFQAEALACLPALYAVAMRLSRNSASAEDLVQDTFLRALKAREQYQSGTNLKAWLLRILRNNFINRYRRSGLTQSIMGDHNTPLADSWTGDSTLRALREPEALMEAPLLQQEIINALDELPVDYRLAVIMADVEELSYKEIAETLGCPVGTVMSRLHRGRAALRQKLYVQAEAMGICPENAESLAERSKEFSEEELSNSSSAEAPLQLSEFRARRKA